MQEGDEKKLKISKDSEAFRIMLLIEALETNERQFAISLGMTQERINNITNGRNGAGYQVIKKIIEIYRNPNPRWLMFGEREVFGCDKAGRTWSIEGWEEEAESLDYLINYPS